VFTTELPQLLYCLFPQDTKIAFEYYSKLLDALSSSQNLYFRVYPLIKFITVVWLWHSFYQKAISSKSHTNLTTLHIPIKTCKMN